LAGAIRSTAGVPLAAVLAVDALPVDIRHASKVDRTRLARWAERVLGGGRVGRP
jgi:predicted regulator of Ras-like GTPase activity (Roadblock/LC7/MglB family)